MWSNALKKTTTGTPGNEGQWPIRGENKSAEAKGRPGHCLQTVSRLWHGDGALGWSCAESLSWAGWAESLGRPVQLELLGQRIQEGSELPKARPPEACKGSPPHPHSRQRRTDSPRAAHGELSKAGKLSTRAPETDAWFPHRAGHSVGSCKSNLKKM